MTKSFAADDFDAIAKRLGELEGKPETVAEPVAETIVGRVLQPSDQVCYILVNKVPQVCSSRAEWRHWSSTHNHITSLGYYESNRKIISTIFIGAFGILFETSVFSLEDRSTNYVYTSTWEEAIWAHADMIKQDGLVV